MDQVKKDYKELLSNVLKKQIIILGPDITLVKARNVKGLKVDNAGNVIEISGPLEELIQELINQFMELSGLIVQKTMEPLLQSLKDQNISGMASIGTQGWEEKQK